VGGALEQQGLCARARQVGKEGKRLRKEEEKFKAVFFLFSFFDPSSTLFATVRSLFIRFFLSLLLLDAPMIP
jgi:hypothetical protein